VPGLWIRVSGPQGGRTICFWRVVAPGAGEVNGENRGTLPVRSGPLHRYRQAEGRLLVSLPELPAPQRRAGVGVHRLRSRELRRNEGRDRQVRLFARHGARLLPDLWLDADLRDVDAAGRDAFPYRRLRGTGAVRAGPARLPKRAAALASPALE